MKIALVHKRYDRIGGAEADLHESAHQLALRGHEVHLVVGECRVPAPAGITTHRVPVVRAGQLAKLLSFALRAPAVWERIGADVVIGFGRSTRGQDLVRASGGCHREYLVRMAAAGGARERLRQRLSVYERVVLALERRQYTPGSFRKVLAVSDLVRREILATHPGVGTEDVAVLSYGVDTARFDPARRASEGAAVRRALGIPLEQPMVLAVGSGFRRKGVDTLLEVWLRPPAGAALVVVGDDRRLAAYRRTARARGGPIVFTGPRRDVERLYAAADLLVLASVQEAFGMVVLEALASGLPVVTSRAAGAAEVLVGPLGELVVEDPRDREALAGALARGLAPEARALLGELGRAAACARSLEASARGLERWCGVVAAGRGGRDG